MAHSTSISFIKGSASGATSASVRSAWNRAALSFFVVFLILVGIPGNSFGQIFSSVQSDKETGLRMAKQVQSQIGLYPAPGLKHYINAIGRRLVEGLKKRRFDFHFDITDQEEPNAFALPGGYIYLSRGILPLANSEDDLATVMAHEIIHVTKRHAAKESERSILPGLLKVPGLLVGSLVGEDLGALLVAPVSLIGKVSLARYSRKQESQADSLGIRLAAKAGYNPERLADMLQQIEKEIETETGQRRGFSFFDDHPTTPHRVKDIEGQAKKISWKPRPHIAKGEAAFLRLFNGLVYGENPETGVFRGQQFLHPRFGFSITFPKGWKLRNSPSSVGAFTENRDAAIFMTGIGKAQNPQALGEAFTEELREKHHVIPERAEAIRIHSFPAYLVSIVGGSAMHPVRYSYLWITMNGRTYRLFGGGVESHRTAVRNTVLSLRPLTRQERAGITVKRIRLVKAVKGETITALCKRTDNAWAPAYTAIINGLSANARLQAGRLIKIAREEKFD